MPQTGPIIGISPHFSSNNEGDGEQENYEQLELPLEDMRTPRPLWVKVLLILVALGLTYGVYLIATTEG